MQPYQERVKQEREELAKKIHDLSQYLAGSAFDQVPYAEQERLKRQKKAMDQYDSILLERIAHFGIEHLP